MADVGAAGSDAQRLERNRSRAAEHELGQLGAVELEPVEPRRGAQIQEPLTRCTTHADDLHARSGNSVPDRPGRRDVAQRGRTRVELVERDHLDVEPSTQSLGVADPGNPANLDRELHWDLEELLDLFIGSTAWPGMAW